MNISAPIRISDYISSSLGTRSSDTPKYNQTKFMTRFKHKAKNSKENKEPNKNQGAVTAAVRIANKIQEYNKLFSMSKGNYS